MDHYLEPKDLKPENNQDTKEKNKKVLYKYNKARKIQSGGKAYHVETKEAIAKEHLNLLIMSRKVAMRIASCVLIDASPFITRWSELVGG